MPLLQPSSIAVIGASSTEGKVGHDILKNLLTQGYEGEVYPINPKSDEILGKKAYPSVSDVEGAIDLAIVVIPAKFVPDVLEECAAENIKNIVIISAGFSEVHTKEGDALEEKVKTIGEKHNLRIVGPNCLGILRPTSKMNASFAKELPEAGSVALVSQSGAMAVAVMDASNELGIGYSTIASIGNKTTMDECDFLELCEKDEDTKVVGLYLESIKDGKRFLDTAMRVSDSLHIVLLKSGVSEHGKEAAASHTGALAGSDAAIDAMCSQAGIHRAQKMEEFLDLLEMLSTQPPLLSPNIAVITNAGGPGILATDAAEKSGLVLPALTERTATPLKEALPKAASTGNPIDVIGDADADRYRAALTACGDDPNIDGICVMLTPQVMTPCEEVAQAIVHWNTAYPLMPITTSFMGDDSVGTARQIVQKNGIPSFETPERAIEALSALLPSTKEKKSTKSIQTNDLRATRAAEILEGHTGLITQATTEELFKLYDIHVPPQKLAQTATEAVEIAEDIGFPVVAKISSPQILHKTDVGGIKANLQTKEEVEEAFDLIMDNVKKQKPDAEIRGVLIQDYLPAGNEFIIGTTPDPSFGHLIMVGLGGIYTELLEDTSFRIPPVSEKDTYHMLQELSAWKVLLGARGGKRLDIEGLSTLLEKISAIVIECPQIKDIDMNPVLVSPDGVIIADAKIVLGS